MSESLFLNTLAFEFPKEPKIFYFSLIDKEDVSLTKLSHQLFPANINDIFPNITNDSILYTSFTRKLEGFTPLSINFATENFALIKRYYNREIRHYFTKMDKLVETTFIKDNQIWLRNRGDKPHTNCTLYDKYTIKVNFNHFTNTPELVLSYDKKTNIYRKSVAAFLFDEETATADLFNKVVHVEYFQHEDKQITKKSITQYKYLKKKEDIDYNNVFPIVGRDFATWLGVDDDQDELSNVFKPTNRYIKYLSKITGFYNQFLNNDNFRKVIPVSEKGFDQVHVLQIGQTSSQSKRLIFGKRQTDVIPQRGVNHGPFRQSRHNNIQLFFITHKEHVLHTNNLSGYLKQGYKIFKGLMQYTNVPISNAPKGFSIAFSDKQNPLPEIELALENNKWDPNVKYIAIYLTPIGKYAQDREQRKIYYQVKEKLLMRNITSQCIESDKMIKIVENDSYLERTGKKGNNFAYTLQNIAIAINAKLGGIPWRIDIPEQKELVVGVGAFKNTDTDIQYIGSAFSFDNNGAFNSFDYFHKDQTSELAGSIEDAIIRYASINEKPNRLIIHFYKEMSENEIQPIENALHNLGLEIPVYVVTINKTESEDFVVFDENSKELMPYSGRYINLGNKTYLLCNNTRYEGDNFKFNAMDGFPFPVKLKIDCPSDNTRPIDTKIIKELIDQVYQFSRIYWKSVKQQNLPVTIKYPEMVAQIAPHFTNGNIPTNIGNDNLWFL